MINHSEMPSHFARTNG